LAKLRPTVGLSAVIVTYNEAHLLPGCLKSLSFCDEMLVIDVGSNDDSVEIAEALGARVISHTWVPFAEKVWAFATEHVTHDWMVIGSPDITYPGGIGERIRGLIIQYEKDGLGGILLPAFTYVGNRPLNYGQKGGARSFRAAVHKHRMNFGGLLHARGDGMRKGYFFLGLLRERGEGVIHYWIADLGEALVKARRYLPYEAESRQAAGQKFTWRGMFAELYRSLKMDLRKFAFLDWRAMQVMVFQLWYLGKANLALLSYQQQGEIVAEREE